jgi:glycosyltransferase involved in cell wall biosynthesis
MMISVILPTYGRCASALECIESVVTNRYSDFELLIIDQGPDKTLEAAVKVRYAGSHIIRYVWSTPPGLNRARNTGLQHAKGKIVAFIDDDAVADENWLAEIASTFSALSPAPVLVGGRIVPVWPGARPRWLPAEREVLLGLYDVGSDGRPFPDGDLPIGANMAGLRDEMLAAGGFHDDLEADAGRPGVQLTGGDSLIGQQLKDAGHVLYYQPRATVYHKISANKLRPVRFLKRHFWEGITEVTRMRLAGTITPANAHSIVSLHRRKLARTLGCALVPGTWRRGDAPWTASAMAILSNVAHSLGTLYAIASKGQSTRAAWTR